MSLGRDELVDLGARVPSATRGSRTLGSVFVPSNRPRGTPELGIEAVQVCTSSIQSGKIQGMEEYREGVSPAPSPGSAWTCRPGSFPQPILKWCSLGSCIPDLSLNCFVSLLSMTSSFLMFFVRSLCFFLSKSLVNFPPFFLVSVLPLLPSLKGFGTPREVQHRLQEHHF